MMNFFLLFLAGVASGFINVLAGGGSMISLPAMTFLGLGLDIANGTNRISILFQNLVATVKFFKGNVLDLKRALFLAIPSTIGAIMGSLTAVSVDKEMLQKTVGIIFLVLSVFILWKPKLWVEQRKVKKRNLLSFIVFLGIGFYGGFLQAGVGIFLMTALVLLEGYDLVRTNAVKVFVIFCFTIVSLTIFAVNGKVDYIAGLMLAAGSVVGAYLGANAALKKGAKFVRFILFFMIIASALKYLFF